MAFPIVLANGPPTDGLQQVADAGVTMVRTGIADWGEQQLDGQIAAERAKLDAARAHGLACWVWLGSLTNLPPGAPSPAERMLTRVVEGLREHPALGAWKGQDEPRNPFNPARSVPPANLARGHRKMNSLDPGHSLVIIQAPRSLVRPRPVPPGVRHHRRRHLSGVVPAGQSLRLKNKDINIVGDLRDGSTRPRDRNPFWMTLQIAWSGVIPTASKPDVVPRFPTRRASASWRTRRS